MTCKSRIYVMGNETPGPGVPGYPPNVTPRYPEPVPVYVCSRLPHSSTTKLFVDKFFRVTEEG
jgi:hypothetical protein